MSYFAFGELPVAMLSFLSILGVAAGCGPAGENGTMLPGIDEFIDTKDAWNGFPVPKETEAEWMNWAKANNELLLADSKLTPEELKEKYKAERGPGTGWPGEWSDVGPGYYGGEHPPWAVVPKNLGLPQECLQSLDYGQVCDVPQAPIENEWPSDPPPDSKRWAYNPYIQECVEFAFKGCGGNDNNFLSNEKCLQDCSLVHSSGCDPETDMYVETNDNDLYDS